ncbi:MAG: PH domain-containing protein [Proteobacteria bacterium]|nr:PH domain-containing protein [Pseudomonadota bacterium]
MGNYVQSNLIKDEQVVYEARLHWIVFVSLRALLTLFIAPLIDYFTSEFAITNKRIIIKVGFISRKTVELNLSKLESVNVEQSILGRILDYGTITVIGTGGTKEPFSNIISPLEFRKQFQQVIATGT